MLLKTLKNIVEFSFKNSWWYLLKTIEKEKNWNKKSKFDFFKFFVENLPRLKRVPKLTTQSGFNLDRFFFRWDKVLFFYRNRYLFHSYQFSFICVFDSFAYDTEIHREVFFVNWRHSRQGHKNRKKKNSMYIKQCLVIFSFIFGLDKKKQSISIEKRFQ